MVFSLVTAFVMKREVFHPDPKESPIQNLWSIKRALRLSLLSNSPKLLAIWASTPKNSLGMFLRVTQVGTLKPVWRAALNLGVQDCTM